MQAILLGLFLSFVSGLSILEARTIIHQCKDNCKEKACIETCFYNHFRGGGMTGQNEIMELYAKIFTEAASLERIN